MATQAQLRANAKYKKEHTKQVQICFFPSDMELYEYLKKQPKMATYIKDLIRADMSNPD